MEDFKFINVADAFILAALPAFEAAARLQNFTRAARELGITQSGLSRRISSLESALGATLFSRRGRSLSITTDGLRLKSAATEALLLIERTRLSLGAPIAGTVRVGALPSIAGLWLARRLDRFLAAHAGISVIVNAIDADFADLPKDPVNWDPSSLDVAITWGRGGWKGLVSKTLAPDIMVPVCSPCTVERYGLGSIEALWNAPLLEHASRAGGWTAYFGAMKYEGPLIRTAVRLRLEHFFMIREAAMAGAGVGLIPNVLIDDDLLAKRLVAPASGWSTGGSYAAVSSSTALARPAVTAFVAWLSLEMNAAFPIVKVQ